MAVFEKVSLRQAINLMEVPSKCRVLKQESITDSFISVPDIETYSFGICTYCSYSKQIDSWESRRKCNDMAKVCWKGFEIEKGWNDYLSSVAEMDVWNYK